MRLTGTQRLQVLKKSGGKCWYCGVELPERRWHADHLQPVYRHKGSLMRKPKNDILSNIVPSCTSCNLFKGVFGIEDFRQELALQVMRGRKFSVNFRMAERFGQLKVTEKPIIFWFEENGKSVKKGEGNPMFKLNKNPETTKLGTKFIKLVKKQNACEEAVIWLEEETRTWGELKGEWKAWCMVEVNDFPIDLRGMQSWDRAWVMAKRVDCEIDLTGMNSWGRAWVMRRRKDCPVDFTEMDSRERALVMADRADCVIDFTGLASGDRALVMYHRGVDG